MRNKVTSSLDISNIFFIIFFMHNAGTEGHNYAAGARIMLNQARDILHFSKMLKKK